MASLSSTEFLVLALCAVTTIAYTIYRRRTNRLPYAPGPPTRLLLGNILHIPTRDPWLKFTEWRRQYGDVVYLHGLGNSFLVLNSLDAVTDLLEKRGTVYSDRPVFTMVGELMGLDRSMPLMMNDPKFRLHRKLMHSALNADAVKKYQVIQEDVAALLCRSMLDDPDSFIKNVRLAAGRVIMTMTYGLKVEIADSEYITDADATMGLISRSMTPGAYLVDLFPQLKYLPRIWPFNFFAEGAAGRVRIEDFVTRPFKHVQRDIVAGDAQPSFTLDLLSESPLDGMNPVEYEHAVKWAAGALYGAGGETTYATVLNCMMLMALHPDKQRIVQAELDAALGSDMPKIADRERLPYLQALIKEVMRWHPALPLGIAHCTAKDDVYNGHFIPKGTVVFPNVWCIATSSAGKYPADQFIPERFLESNADASLADPAAWAFGFGRRICPGKLLGENSLLSMIASILVSFDIAPSSEGLEPRFSDGLISYPEHFKVQITPRSDARVRAIRERAAHCRI
ncbi:cytochrome P450 [Dentipellis sp. KUC8613]|nr:cytochrome P450 [Dentipellis sp. KUC8613]